MIVVNFKTYAESTGKKARRLGEACEKVNKEKSVEIIAVPQTQDILRLENLDLETYSQHIDTIEPGSHTGSVLPEGVKAAGASGTLINHSEKRLKPEKIEKTVQKAREHGLTTIVCAQNPEECEEFSKFKPDYIAYEPPELIGGDISVSSAKPELIREAVEKSGEIPTLTGAGIKDSKDVSKSLELGCEGVLIASGVVKSDNSLESLKELCKGYDN